MPFPFELADLRVLFRAAGTSQVETQLVRPVVKTQKHQTRRGEWETLIARVM